MQTKLKYPPKVLLAWIEAVGGNSKIRDWLLQNGFKELGMFCFALRNKDAARQWLMDNNFPHLMALINGVEGNIKAVQWLDHYGFHVLSKVALAGDSDQRAFQWLIDRELKLMALLAKKIEFVKLEIEEKNNDIHHF